MIVSEIFESVQGEGPNIGRPSVFLRLGGCNLHCVWCDAAYTWRFSNKHDHDDPTVYDRKELKKMSSHDVLLQITNRPSKHIVITGGEPLLQRNELEHMLRLLFQSARGYSVEFETAGTLRPLALRHSHVSYVVSPKLENSGNTVDERYHPGVLKEFREMSSVFKFVVSSIADLYEINELVRAIRIPPKYVYIMPEGVTVERICQVSEEIVRPVIERGYNLTTRLQIITFGNKRGT